MRILVGLMAFTALGFAADEQARRLESVSWNPVDHQLQWVISKGEKNGDQYKPGKRYEYVIDIDDATMSYSDETRRFTHREAESVRQLLDILARYAVESTIWWEHGQGEPVTNPKQKVSLPEPLKGLIQELLLRDRCSQPDLFRLGGQDFQKGRVQPRLAN